MMTLPKTDVRILAALMFSFSFLWPNSAVSQQVPEGFLIETIAKLEDNDLGFDFLPDGRIIVISKSGKTRIVVNGSLSSRLLLDHPDVDSRGEGGLLGVAVDPGFPDEPYVYLFYSSKRSRNVVSRFTASGDLSDPDSDNLRLGKETILLGDMPSFHKQHNAGTIRIAGDGTLYISHGDDKFRPGPDDETKDKSLVQDLRALNGKILRINRDGSIPDDNPDFPHPEANARPEIFAFGLRNPFRFAVDPLTNGLFIGDVGASDWEEFDLASGGENFGWPRYEADSVNDSKVTLRPPAPTFPIFKFANRGSGSPASGIALVTYRQVDFPNDSSFPREYDGAHFYADHFKDYLRYLVHERTRWTDVWVSRDFGRGFNRLVDGALGKDGSIYLLEYGLALKKISYVGEPARKAENGGN